MAIDITFFIFLALSAYTDIRFRKVYNAGVIAAVILGLGLNLFYLGLPGIGSSLLGLIAGFAFLLVFYILGGIGAGDVKFMAAVGCLKGAGFVLLGGLYGAVLGGLAAVTVLIVEKRLFNVVKNIFSSFLTLVAFRIPEAMKLDTGRASYLPYTVFLSLGLILRWAELYFNF